MCLAINETLCKIGRGKGAERKQRWYCHPDTYQGSSYHLRPSTLTLFFSYISIPLGLHSHVYCFHLYICWISSEYLFISSALKFEKYVPLGVVSLTDDGYAYCNTIYYTFLVYMSTFFTHHSFIRLLYNKEQIWKKTVLGFPDGTVVKNPPANAGETGSSPGPGRSHMPRKN